MMKLTLFGKKRDLLVLLVILGTMAVLLAVRDAPHPRVTVSGLALSMSTQAVESQLGDADFRTRAYGAYILEYWAQKDRPELRVWSQDDVVYKIEGGVPEIDGQDARGWSLTEVQRQLGEPSHGGSGRAVGGAGHSFLSYPQHRLLVQEDDSHLKFILFKSGRD
jgi:hypothetical protein